MNIKQQLINVYLDWVNSFLTIRRFAEHYDLTYNEAIKVINLGRQMFQNRKREEHELHSKENR